MKKILSRARHLRLTRSIALLMVLLVGMVSATSAQDGDEDGRVLEPVIRQQTETEMGIQVQAEFPATQDTFVASNYPDTNYGSMSSLRIGFAQAGWDPAGALRSFLQFDISSIPSNAVINWAQLQVYQYQVSPASDADMEVTTRHLNPPTWNEYTVTWNNGPNWGPIFDQGLSSSSLGWKSADATELVRSWHSGSVTNNGLLFQGDERDWERQRWFYSRNANNAYYPRLVVDYTVQNDTTPPTASVNALPAWSRAQFTVSWSGSDNPGGSGIDYYDVQYNVNGGAWTDGLMRTQQTSAQVPGQNGVRYGFRARAVDRAGNQQAWTGEQAWTQVDTIPPTVSVDGLPQYTVSSSFFVSWSGSDNSGGSGLARYDVQYRIGGGDWQDWRTNTTATSATFSGAQDGVTYSFRARGIDNAGNVQAYSSVPQAETTVVLNSRATVDPFSPPILRHTDLVTTSFPVAWTGFAAPGTTIVSYEVRVRFNRGPWSTFTVTQQTSDVFVIPNPEDGVYDFEAAATNSLGQVEPFEGITEASKAVDRLPPYITPGLYMPMIVNDRP